MPFEGHFSFIFIVSSVVVSLEPMFGSLYPEMIALVFHHFSCPLVDAFLIALFNELFSIGIYFFNFICTRIWAAYVRCLCLYAKIKHPMPSVVNISRSSRDKAVMFSLRVSVSTSLRSAAFAKRCLSTAAEVSSRLAPVSVPDHSAPQDGKIRIPVIDFSRFLNAKSPAQKKPTADAVVAAFKDSGFIYLENHGVAPDTVKNVFAKVDDTPCFPREST
jgi:hypothetical protein